MYTTPKEKNEKIIDISSFSQHLTSAESFPDMRTEEMKLDDEVAKYLNDKIGDKYVLLRKSPKGNDMHIFFAGGLNPVSDLMPAIVTLVFQMSQRYDLDPLNVFSAIFTAGYGTLMEAQEQEFQATCGQCEQFKDNSCTCSGDCDNCSENDYKN